MTRNKLKVVIREMRFPGWGDGYYAFAAEDKDLRAPLAYGLREEECESNLRNKHGEIERVSQ